MIFKNEEVEWKSRNNFIPRCTNEIYQSVVRPSHRFDEHEEWSCGQEIEHSRRLLEEHVRIAEGWQ